MNLHDVIGFASGNPVCFMATAEGGQPRVRAVMLMQADENGFVFETISNKQFSKQLHTNPKAEVCFYNSPANVMEAKQLRITGEVEFIEDQKTVDEIYEKVRPLADHAGVDMRPNFEVFSIEKGEARFWTMNDIGKEAYLEKIAF